MPVRYRYFIETHPEILPLLHFLKTYKAEWTSTDLSRDYPKYREENISSYITRLNAAEIISKAGRVKTDRRGNLSVVWKLTQKIRLYLEQ